MSKLNASYLSLISQLNTPGFSFLYPSILASISGVASLGLLPPSTPGLMEPVSWKARHMTHQIRTVDLFP